MNNHTRPPETHLRSANSAAIVQIRVIGALILRDVRARMGGSAWNYGRFIIVPLFHLMSLAAFATFTGRAAPLGTDRVVFFISGILPFILFLYPIRSNINVIDETRTLLVFPIVNPIDIILARVILEAINSIILIIIVSTILYSFGNSVIPKNSYKTLCGIAVTIMFSISFCITNAVMARLVANWTQACVLTAIALYITSGAFILPSQAPEMIRELMYFNPLAHCVEWIRSGYYETYNEGLLDPLYLGSVTLAFFAFGLTMERFLRGRLG